MQVSLVVNVRLWPKPDTIWSNQDARMVKLVLPRNCGHI